MSFADQISTLAFVLILVQLTRNIDITNPHNIFLFRLAYATSQLLMLGTAYFVLRKIAFQKDTRKIKVPEPAKPLSSDPKVVHEMTVFEYDTQKVKEFIKQTVFSSLFLIFLHWKFEFVQPLLIQSILPLKTALFLPIFKIHLLGYPAEGDLERPFKAPPSPFADLMKDNSNDNNTNSNPSNPKSEKLPPKSPELLVKNENEKKEL